MNWGNCSDTTVPSGDSEFDQVPDSSALLWQQLLWEAQCARGAGCQSWTWHKPSENQFFKYAPHWIKGTQVPSIPKETFFFSNEWFNSTKGTRNLDQINFSRNTYAHLNFDPNRVSRSNFYFSELCWPWLEEKISTAQQLCCCFLENAIGVNSV